MPDDDDAWGNSRYFKGGEAKIRTENGKLINYIELLPRTQQMRTNCLEGYRKFFQGTLRSMIRMAIIIPLKPAIVSFLWLMSAVAIPEAGVIWNTMPSLIYGRMTDWILPINCWINHRWDGFWTRSKIPTATWKFIAAGVPSTRISTVGGVAIIPAGRPSSILPDRREQDSDCPTVCLIISARTHMSAIRYWISSKTIT